MRSPNVSEQRALIDQVRPDAVELGGFRQGVVITHDLNTRALYNELLPALMGVDHHRSDRRRVEARAAFLGRECRLVVLAAADRVAHGPVQWPGVTIIPVANRRLHAKAYLLEYDRGVRTWITSANLTAAGLQKNWELWIAETVRLQNRRPAIARDLLIEIHRLAAQLSSELDGPQFDSWLGELRSVRRALSGVVPSGAAGRLRANLADRTMPIVPPASAPGRRVVIISPGFGSDPRPVARALRTWIHPEYTHVQLITDGIDMVSRCPTELRDMLARNAKSFDHQIVDSNSPDRDVDSGARSRILHGKLLARVDSDGQAQVLLGSANLTGPGLGGRNRELMIDVDMTEAELDRLLASLDTCTPIDHRPVPDPAPTDQVPDLSDVHACFVAHRISRRHHLLEGILRLAWNPRRPPLTLSYCGQPVALEAEQHFTLFENTGTLLAERSGQQLTVPLEVDATAIAEEFAKLIDEDDPEPRERVWHHLLFDLQRVQSGSRLQRPPDRSPLADDRFGLSLERRLVELARYRRSLRDNGTLHDLDSLLALYLEDSEVPVATSVLMPERSDSADPLIRALARAFEAVDADRQFGNGAER